MWRLLTVLVTLAVLLVVATVPQSGLVAIAAQQVSTIMPHDLQPVPNPQLPTAERLAQLHKALASSGDPHDVILEIGRIGDATSVPFLIEALAKQGTVPREGQYAAIDTRFHVLDALQSITNHDAGRNAEDWRPWYEKNKGKTQAQWIKDGFVEHPSVPSGRRVRHGIDSSVGSQISAAVPANKRPANSADSLFGNRRTIGESTERFKRECRQKGDSGSS